MLLEKQSSQLSTALQCSTLAAIQLTSTIQAHEDGCRCEECRCEECWREGYRYEACCCEIDNRRLIRSCLINSLTVLDQTVSFPLLLDEIIPFKLYIELQIALMHNWEPNASEIQLLKAYCENDPALGELKRLLYYDSGGSKAVLALYQAAPPKGKRWFVNFEALSGRGQKSLIHLTKGLTIDQALLSRITEKERTTCTISILLTTFYLTQPQVVLLNSPRFREGQGRETKCFNKNPSKQ